MGVLRATRGGHAGIVSALAVLAMLMGVAPGAQSAPAGAPIVEDPIVIDSFDGEPIVATLMLPAEASPESPVPAVLMTHGWGGSRSREPGGAIGRLVSSGYAVLTWDSRGFGDSGGEANVGSPDFEVKDASALIDYLAARPEILTDGPGDPRVGWIGGSNAAGVQFNTAAIDKRVDAIVPIISWGNLPRDLLPNGVVKQSWDELLYAGGAVTATLEGADSPAGPQPGNYAPEIHIAHAQISSTGTISEDIRAWFAHKSTTVRSHRIEAPTLIIQGSIDTLFPLEDGFANYRKLVAAETPVKLMTYCGGHTLSGCPYPGGESGRPGSGDGAPLLWEERALAWLDRHVVGDRAPTGAGVEWQAQDGYYYRAPRYPLPGTKFVRGRRVAADLAGPGPGGGDGPADGNPAPDDELGVSAARTRILGRFPTRRPMLGVPRVWIRGRVTGVSAQLFFELIDVNRRGKRTTIDDQVMPVKLEGGAFRRRLALHGVSWIVKPGHRIELEVTTGSTSYGAAREGPFEVSLSARPRLPLAPHRWATAARRAR
ncbi:MAG: alpha/beta fold hydrolase [Actinomycetota bacterium]